MNKNELKGIFAAIPTPMNDSGSKLDEERLCILIERLMKTSINGFLVTGGTGEYNSLSKEERKTVLQVTIDCVRGKLPVIAGILAPGLYDATEMLKIASSHKANAAMVINPYYIISTQEGLMDYFKALDQITSLPIIIYNMPSRTRVNLSPATLSKLLDETENIIGVKESSLDGQHLVELIKLCGRKAAVLSGEEYTTFSGLLLGAQGAILPSANIIPNMWTQIYHNIACGNIEKAREDFFRICPFINSLFVEANPGPLKQALRFLNIDTGGTRQPLTPLKQENVAFIKTLMESSNIDFI